MLTNKQLNKYSDLPTEIGGLIECALELWNSYNWPSAIMLLLHKREPSLEYSPAGAWPDLVSLVPCLGNALGVVGVIYKNTLTNK